MKLQLTLVKSPVSSKPNHSGLGLRNIEMIAEKYEGGVEFTHDPHVFHSSVMLVL